MAGISRLQMMNLENKINDLFRKGGFSFIGWIREKDNPDTYDSQADYKGILFKPLFGGSPPPPIAKCKDVADLMAMKEERNIGFYLFPMLAEHFDNLEQIIQEGKEERDQRSGNDGETIY